jgi:hypothetical protein
LLNSGLVRGAIEKRCLVASTEPQEIRSEYTVPLREQRQATGPAHIAGTSPGAIVKQQDDVRFRIAGFKKSSPEAASLYVPGL